jgi:hypothetical protein
MKKLIPLIGLILSTPFLAEAQIGAGAMGGMAPGAPGVRQVISPKIVLFQLHNRPASVIIPLLQPFLRSATLACDERTQTLLLQYNNDEEEQAIKNLIFSLDQPSPKIQSPSFQLSFYFIKCQLNQDAVYENAVRETWERLQDTIIPDPAVFKASLRKVFNDFKVRGIRLLVRWDILETEGVSPDDEMKFQFLEGLKNISLRQALEIIVKTMGPPEAKISYAIDSDGMVVISTAESLPKTNKPKLLPEFLKATGNSLAKNGFGNPELIAPFMIKSQENGTFQAMGFLVGQEGWTPAKVEEIPIWAAVKGQLTRNKDGKTLQLEIQSTLMAQSTPPATQPAGASIPSQKREIFSIKTTTVTPEGDYVILAGTPAGLMPGQAIALVIRVDAEGTSPTLAPKQ